MNIYTYMCIIYPHSPKYNLFSPYNATCIHVFRTGPFGTEHSGEDHLLPFPAPSVAYSLDGGLTCVTFSPSIWRVHQRHPGSVRLLSDHFLSYCLPLWYPYRKWEQVIESVCLLSPPLPAPSLLVSIRKWSEEGKGSVCSGWRQARDSRQKSKRDTINKAAHWSKRATPYKRTWKESLSRQVGMEILGSPPFSYMKTKLQRLLSSRTISTRTISSFFLHENKTPKGC